MKNKLICIGILAISCGIFSCVSTPASTEIADTQFVMPTIKEMVEAGHVICRPTNDTLTIIGMSNRLVKRSTEVDEAKKDAARLLSIYQNGVYGVFEYFNQSGSAGYFDAMNLRNDDLTYDTDLGKYEEKLSYDPEKDVYVCPKATFVRFTFTGSLPKINYVAKEDKDGRPIWTKLRDLPVIDGYDVVVGMAQNQMYIRTAINKSIDAAITGLIQRKDMSVKTNEMDKMGSGNLIAIYTKSEGKIDNFLVLEYWFEPNGYVYTLAIARSK